MNRRATAPDADPLSSGDIVDRLVEDWSREKPELDTAPMAVVGRLLRVGRQLDARIGEILRPYGLRYSEFDVLATLLRSGKPYELTPTELQHAVILTSGAMTALLDRLTRQDLIMRRQSKVDGRSKTARLTPKGVRLATKLLPLRFEEAREAVECLSAVDQAETARVLRTLGNWLERLEG